MFVFPQSYRVGFQPQIHIATSLDVIVYVNITTPIWNSIESIEQSIALTKDQIQIVYLPEAVRASGSGIGNTSVLVRSTGEIVLYATNVQENSGDSSLIFPTSVASTEYVALTHNQVSTYHEYLSIVVIVSLSTGNEVSIAVPVHVSMTYDYVVYSGQEFTVSLGQYQFVQLQAHDLSGTLISALTKVVVICAHTFIRIGSSTTKDYIQTMIPPLNSLSSEYIVFGHPLHSKPTHFRAINPYVDTDLLITTTMSNSVTLEDRGSIYDFELSPGEGATVSANMPFLIGIFAPSRFKGSKGDDSMVVALGISNFLTEYYFLTPLYSGTTALTHSLLVISKGPSMNVYLDGKHLQTDYGLTWAPISNTELWFVNEDITYGAHSLISVDPSAVFAAYLYTYGDSEGYTTVTGRYLGPTQVYTEGMN